MPDDGRSRAVEAARTWLGVPFRHQGRTCAGVDCVGLLVCVAREMGIRARDVTGYRGVPYEGVPVGTIKRHATGKGNAPKAAMIDAARARGFSPTDDNEADAIAILLWAIETQGGVQ